MKINLILVLVLCFGVTIFPGRKKRRIFTPEQYLQIADKIVALDDYDDAYDADCESGPENKSAKQENSSGREPMTLSEYYTEKQVAGDGWTLVGKK